MIILPSSGPVIASGVSPSSAGTVSSQINPGTKPTAAIRECCISRLCESGSVSALSSGQEFQTAIYLFSGDLVSSITFWSGTAAYSAGTSPHRFFALRGSTGTLLAQSADDGANAWASYSLKTLAMATPYSVTQSGWFYLCGSCEMTGGTHNNYHGDTTDTGTVVAADPKLTCRVSGVLSSGVLASSVSLAGSNSNLGVYGYVS